MTVDRIELQDYARHESLTVDFHPRLTTIVGLTDAGKSALLSCLRWICLNIPAGVSMIRRGSKGADCRAVIDGHTIRRRRMTDGSNEYLVDDGAALVAFGTGVPDQVEKLTHVDLINFVGQKEPDFWFSLPPAEVSRQLNAVVDLGVIDSANEKISKRIWQAQEGVRVSQAALDEATKQRDALEWTAAADRCLKDAEAAEQRAVAVSEKRKKLESALERIRQSHRQAAHYRAYWDAAAVVGRSWAAYFSVQDRLVRLASALEALKESHRKRSAASMDTSAMDQVIAALEGVHSRRERLDGLLNGIRQHQSSAERCRRIASAAEVVLTAVDRAKAAEDRANALEMALTRLKSCQQTVARLAQERILAEKRLQDATGGRCPVCGSEMEAGA